MRFGFINKQIIILVGVAIGLLVLVQMISVLPSSQTDSEKNASSGKMARLVLDWGNGTKRMFEGETVSGMSVWHALVQSAQAGNLDVTYSYKGSRDYVEVQKIGNAGMPSGIWVFYVNGIPVESQSVALKTIKPGDVIEVKFVPR